MCPAQIFIFFRHMLPTPCGDSTSRRLTLCQRICHTHPPPLLPSHTSRAPTPPPALSPSYTLSSATCNHHQEGIVTFTPSTTPPFTYHTASCLPPPPTTTTFTGNLPGVFFAVGTHIHTCDVIPAVCGRSLQSACGVSPSGAPCNAALHALFSAASTLGDEAFYTVALPLCAWMLDLELSRRLAFFWASTYYVGQSAKVLLL